MKESKAENAETQRERLLEKMIEKTKAAPNYNSITKIIKIVKQVFNVTS